MLVVGDSEQDEIVKAQMVEIAKLTAENHEQQVCLLPATARCSTFRHVVVKSSSTMLWKQVQIQEQQEEIAELEARVEALKSAPAPRINFVQRSSVQRLDSTCFDVCSRLGTSQL